jgi:hypothetical protein
VKRLCSGPVANIRMSRAVEGQVRLQKGGYVGDVTALTLLPNPDPSAPAALLLAGCGGALHVYRVRCGRMLLLHRVLDGARIHGIQVGLHPVRSQHSGLVWRDCFRPAPRVHPPTHKQAPRAEGGYTVALRSDGRR